MYDWRRPLTIVDDNDYSVVSVEWVWPATTIWNVHNGPIIEVERPGSVYTRPPWRSHRVPGWYWTVVGRPRLESIHEVHNYRPLYRVYDQTIVSIEWEPRTKFITVVSDEPPWQRIKHRKPWRWRNLTKYAKPAPTYTVDLDDSVERPIIKSWSVYRVIDDEPLIDDAPAIWYTVRPSHERWSIISLERWSIWVNEPKQHRPLFRMTNIETWPPKRVYSERRIIFPGNINTGITPHIPNV